MSQVVSSGKVGYVSFLIMPNNDNYNATITSPSETIEITCNNWKSAKDVVKKTITRLEENDNENGRCPNGEEAY